ncbi:MAG: hypothetical protein WC641_08450 [Patescibacteria group bacterium]
MNLEPAFQRDWQVRCSFRREVERPSILAEKICARQGLAGNRCEVSEPFLREGDRHHGPLRPVRGVFRFVAEGGLGILGAAEVDATVLTGHGFPFVWRKYGDKGVAYTSQERMRERPAFSLKTSGKNRNLFLLSPLLSVTSKVMDKRGCENVELTFSLQKMSERCKS